MIVRSAHLALIMSEEALEEVRIAKSSPTPGTQSYMSPYRTLRYEFSQSDRTGLMPTSDKENTVFYLKLQWISAKDDAERERLGKKIRQLLGT